MIAQMMEQLTKDDFLNAAVFLIVYIVMLVMILMGVVIGINYINSLTACSEKFTNVRPFTPSKTYLDDENNMNL
jgi:hypothetical protein